MENKTPENRKQKSLTFEKDSRMIKKSSIICISLLTGIGLLLIIGCAKKETVSVVAPPEKAEEGSEMAEDVEGKIMTFSLTGFTERGDKKWELEGNSADISSEKIKLEKVKIHAYSEDNVIILTANKGYFDKMTNDMHLEENVVAITKDGAKLTTDYLDWKAETEVISTDAGVFVERDNMTAKGTGAYAQSSLKKVRLDKDVTVNIIRSDTGNLAQENITTKITCTGPLEIDYDKQIAVFNDNVKVTDARGDIFGDKIDVYLNPKEEKINKAVAVGNVKIVREGNTSYSQHAVYEAKKNKLTLTGRPKLMIYTDSKVSFSEINDSE